MKKFLLPENGNFYKANLHCHSNISDGALSPEELKKIYTEKGYSIIAYTDHDIMLPHHDLTDENFLALTGFEMEFNEWNKPEFAVTKTAHFCFIALSPDQRKQPNRPHDGYLFGNAKNYVDQVKYDESHTDYERSFSPECVNDMIRMGRENGFFVTYNHPTWSQEDYNDYMAYKNFNAMEICNYSSYSLGYPEYNERVYDDMLRGGERLYCIGADDNHNRHPEASGLWDSFGAFTMIKAENLEYETITEALVNGHFYASQGPKIHELWFEDGQLHVTCSGAARITMTAGRRKAYVTYSHMGEPVEAASFPVAPEDNYVRITVTDARGYHANTNAYFTDELFEEA